MHRKSGLNLTDNRDHAKIIARDIRGRCTAEEGSSLSPEIAERKKRSSDVCSSTWGICIDQMLPDERATGCQMHRTVTWRQDSRMRLERASASAMEPVVGFLPPYLANPSRIKDERLDCHNEKAWQIFVEIIRMLFCPGNTAVKSQDLWIT